jgi:hypothetical protein
MPGSRSRRSVHHLPRSQRRLRGIVFRHGYFQGLIILPSDGAKLYEHTLMQITADEFRRRYKAIAGLFGSAPQLEALLREMALTRAAAGTELIQFHGPCSTLYLRWEGSLAVSIEGNGAAIRIGELGPGEWVGEVTLIEPGSASATVTAIKDSVLLALPHEAFGRLQARDPAAASALLHAISLNLAERLRVTGARATQCIGQGAEHSDTLPPEERAGVIGLVANLMGIRGAR